MMLRIFWHVLPVYFIAVFLFGCGGNGGSPFVLHISSNSWGAPDGTGNPSASSLAWKTAIDTGLNNGRGGKGTIYVWVAGNGAAGLNDGSCPSCIDNSNYDGQANYRGVIAVGAVTDQGTKASYSERGGTILSQFMPT